MVERLNGSLESVLTQAGNKLVVIDFGATWYVSIIHVLNYLHGISFLGVVRVNSLNLNFMT